MSVESGNDFGQVDLEAAADVANKWFQLPLYTEIFREELDRMKRLTARQGEVKAFIEEHLASVKELLGQGDSAGALCLINQRLVDINTRFTGDDAITARIFTLRRRAYIKEHNATYGDLSRLPLGHPEGNSCFISAATDYMQADIELGSKSDFALRVSECFGGAQMGEYQIMALQMALGENVTLVSKTDSGAMSVLGDLVRRATETTDLGKVPGGGKVNVIKGRLPDSRAN